MMSEADCFVTLPRAEREKRLSKMTARQLAALHWSWDWWGRPEQHAPTATADQQRYWQYRDGRWQHAQDLASWTYWLCNAGRGWGKTRTGAEWVRRKIRTTNRVSLVAPTAHDIRAVMVEGPQGILNICPRGERPEYDPSLLRLRWPNGNISELFSADEPERLRGPAHGAAWCDELAAWRYLGEAWDQLQFGLRMGENPQCCITTTPKNVKVFKDILVDPGTIVSRGTTRENAHNLAPTFLQKIVGRYIGTRLGRQELDAELLDDNPSALWRRSVIDMNRVARCPALARIVVAIDPMGSIRNPDAECGIVVAGLGEDGDGYVLNDISEAAKPDQWGATAVAAYRANKADRIIAEVNFGGDMVEAVIRTVDPNVSYKSVTASRGKAVRAEPVAALYEQNRVHHVGSFPKLEDEMCDWDPADRNAPSPNRMDALVWAMTELKLAPSVTGLLDWITGAQDKPPADPPAPMPARHERAPIAPKGTPAFTIKTGSGFMHDGD
jgi:phage terminase large subunit-like protein